jgi:hypothetical protein
MELIGNISHLVFDKVLWNAVFPSAIVLIVFTFFNLKAFKRNSQFYFVLSTLIVVMFVRLVFGVAFGGGAEGGWDCESRRFYGIAALLICFIVVGFPVVINFTKKITDKYYKKRLFSRRMLVVFWVLICGGACIGKGLAPMSYKNYVHEHGIIIKNYTPANSKSLLIYGTGSWRERYYSNADKCVAIAAVFNEAKPEYFYSALKVLKEKGYKPYIYVDNSDDKFNKKFINKGVEFKLKLIKKWKNGKYSLYECGEE